MLREKRLRRRRESSLVVWGLRLSILVVEGEAKETVAIGMVEKADEEAREKAKAAKARKEARARVRAAKAVKVAEDPLTSRIALTGRSRRMALLRLLLLHGLLLREARCLRRRATIWWAPMARLLAPIPLLWGC